MNRTTEYLKLLPFNEKKQPKARKYPIEPQDLENLKNKIKNSQLNFDFLKNEIKKMKEQIEDMNENNEHVMGIKRSVEVFLAEMMLEINQKIREEEYLKNQRKSTKIDQSKKYSYDPALDDTHNRMNTQIAFQSHTQETKRRSTTDQIHQHHINTHLQELNHLISEISIQTQIQGENLKRINSIVSGTGRNAGLSVLNLEKVMENVRGRRKAIVWFVLAWFFILVLILLFKNL